MMEEAPTYPEDGGSGGYGGGGGSGYGGSGGAVGGFTLPGTTNYSGYTGVGSGTGYHAFTPFNVIPSKRLKGNEEIRNSGGAILSFLQSIFGQYQHGDISSTEALAEATQVQGILYNDSYYKQDVSKGSLKELSSLKSQAQSIISSIVSWVSPTSNPSNPTVTPTTTPAPTDSTATLLEQLRGLLDAGSSSSSTFEAPPNLYQVTPTNSNSTGSSNMPKILILAAIAVAAYFLYKRYA